MSHGPSVPVVGYRLVPLSLSALDALARDDLAEATALTGERLTPFLIDEGWLWRLRLDQVTEKLDDLEWIARPAIALDGPDAGHLVGHIGFHGAPDDEGRVEVGYTVDPAYRRRGHARGLLRQVITDLEADPRVHVLRASISPTHVASLGTIRCLGFARVGEQHDPDDGPETIYERRL